LISQMTEIDYTSEQGKKVELPAGCRKVRLAMRFFTESVTTVNLLFFYSFTQNSDKDDQKQVMRQQFRKPMRIRSQGPFRVEWDVKHSDPFIQNLRLRNEQLQIAPMVAPSGEECWVNVNLTSQSASKVIYLARANLEILEKSKVKLL
jgi:hypothetical protein